MKPSERLEQKEIILKNGMIAIVDADDFKYLKEIKWYPSKGKTRKDGTVLYYAHNPLLKKHGGKNQFMHRVIMNAEKHQIIDHINGNGLDNRKANLRFVDVSSNSQNRIFKLGPTGFIGVNQRHPNGPFRTRINYKGGLYQRHGFKTPLEAALHYDEMAIKFYGPAALTNERAGLLRKALESDEVSG